MKVYGDVERVNLATGERFRRVSGDGESRLVSCCEHNRLGPGIEREQEMERNATRELDKLVEELKRIKMDNATSQTKFEPLTYEQEVHAVLCGAASTTEDLLRYFEAQAAIESGDAKKLTLKCIEFKRDALRRILALIPQALERREATKENQNAL